MSEKQIKEYYERIEKLLNGANKETYGFAPQEIKNILRSYEALQNQNQELKNQLETLEKVNKQLIYKLDRYDAIVDERDELKKQLEVGEEQYNDLVEEKEKLDAENQVLKDYKNVALTYMKNYLKMELNYRNKDVAEHFKMVIDMLNRGNKHDNLVDITDCDTQQKEFIDYMNKTIEELECDDVDDEEMKVYLIQRIDTFKEILSKYKRIIGSDINVGSIGDKE